MNQPDDIGRGERPQMFHRITVLQGDLFIYLFIMHLKLRRKCKEDSLKVEESRKQGRDRITGQVKRLCGLSRVNTLISG